MLDLQWWKRALMGLVLAFFFDAQAATIVQIDTARINSVKALLLSQKGDGSWASGADKIPATTSALEALRRAGVVGYPYTKGISWLASMEALNTDFLARQIITLQNAGLDTSSLVSRLIALRNDTTLSWGSYDHYNGSFPDTSLALDAIKTTNAAYSGTGNGLGFITSKQNAEGGWPFSGDAPATAQSQIVPTAYNLITLNHFKSLFGVQTNINNGIAWLKSQQKVGGGFGEGMAGNVLETALAYQALVTEVGSNDSTAVLALDFLIAQQMGYGGWGGDVFRTALVMQTLPSARMADTDKDGVPDDVENAIGYILVNNRVVLSNPLVADSRWLSDKGNGNSLGGVTAADVRTGYINQSATGAFSGVGVRPYYGWSITSGALPPGLIVDYKGYYSGVPTELGSYASTHVMTDAIGVTASVAIRFDIVRTTANGHGGDINGDGVVDAADVDMAQRISLGLLAPTAVQLLQADVAPNGAWDGAIDSADVFRIQRKALGLEDF